MNSVLIPTRPKWCEKICHEIGKDKNGKPIYEKRIEVRKSAPKGVPFKAYIYCTKEHANEIVLLKDYKNRFSFGDYRKADDHFYTIANGKVIGEFICDKVYLIKNQGNRFVVANEEQGVTNEIARQSCLDYDDMVGYLGNKDGYGWHISDLKVYDKPKELSEFGRKCDYASEIHCRDCLILGDWDSCCGVMCKPLTRPPQSWQYVEELR